MVQEIQPMNWKCPDCGKQHNKAHWQDYHQKDLDWKKKLHNAEKNSDPSYQIVCEVCGKPLGYPPLVTTFLNWCPSCRKTQKTGMFCMKCGKPLIAKPGQMDYCSTCKKKRKGIHAPLFCPHCGYVEERLVIVRVR